MLRVLLLAILVIIVIRVLWRLFGAVLEGSRAAGGPGGVKAVKLVQDPVCGTYVTPNATLSLGAGGQTHYFCSEECRRKFRGGR